MDSKMMLVDCRVAYSSTREKVVTYVIIVHVRWFKMTYYQPIELKFKS